MQNQNFPTCFHEITALGSQILLNCSSPIPIGSLLLTVRMEASSPSYSHFAPRASLASRPELSLAVYEVRRLRWHVHLV